MGCYSFILAVALVGIAWADESCPTANEIKPCTCDGEGINCMLATSLDQIKRAFRSNFKYGGIRAVWIQGTPIRSVPADLFGNVKSAQFYIEVNNITSVDMNAFRASKDTLRQLSFFGNQLSSFPYSELQSYPFLGSLNLGKNKFTSIPDNAFKSSSLDALLLIQNQISHIGKNAFKGLTSLSNLQLSYNRLTTLGPYSLALKSNAAALQIHLQVNQISSVSSTAFDGVDPQVVLLSSNRLTSLHQDNFAALVQNIANKRGFMEVSANPFTCKGCDYAWLVLNKNILKDLMQGFRCPDGTGIEDLTNSRIGCQTRRALF